MGRSGIAIDGVPIDRQFLLTYLKQANASPCTIAWLVQGPTVRQPSSTGAISSAVCTSAEINGVMGLRGRITSPIR